MDQSNTTTGTVIAGPSQKDLKKKYGVRKTPLLVPATATAYRKDMNFDEQFKIPGPNYVETHSWVIIDPSRGLLIRANTYNSNLGEKVDYLNESNVRPIPGFVKDADGKDVIDPATGLPTPDKDRKKALKGYSPIALDQVPFLMVDAPVAPEAPADEEEEEDTDDNA